MYNRLTNKRGPAIRIWAVQCMLYQPVKIYVVPVSKKMIAPINGHLYPTTTNNNTSAVGTRCKNKSETFCEILCSLLKTSAAKTNNASAYKKPILVAATSHLFLLLLN